MSGTSVRITSRWARAGAAGALVAAAVVAVDLVGAPSGAQEAALTLTAIPGVGVNADQSISDDGQVVVYEETTLDQSGVPATRVLIHDRVSGATTGVAELGAMNPAVSGNGCFVTYSTFTPDVEEPPDTTTTSTTTTTTTTTTSVPESTTTTTSVPESSTTSTSDPVVDVGADGPAADEQPIVTEAPVVVDEPQALVRQAIDLVASGTSTLYAFDRCADPLPQQAVVVVRDIAVTESLGVAAVSFDGTVIAFSNGNDIIRMQGTLTGYVAGVPFDSAVIATPAAITGPNIDMSSDGSTIVFEAGTDANPDDAIELIDFGVHVWTNVGVTEVTSVASNSTSPTVSADGSAIAFVSEPGSDSGFLGVAVQTQLDDGSAANISIDPFGSQPDLSEDGQHVVYNTTAGRTSPGMAMTSSVGGGNIPFLGVSTIDLSVAAAGAPATTFAVSGPAVSAQGNAVALDADVSDQAKGTPQVIAVRTLTASGSLDAEAYDLGSGDVGDTLAATATFTNQGPASVGFATEAIAIESPFVVGSTTCVGSIGPGASCVIELTVTIESLEDLFGSFVLTGLDGSNASAELTALGERATTTTDQATTTTPPNTTPRNTTVNTTRTTTRNTTRTTTRNTTSNTTQTTSANTVVNINLPPTFEPTTFDFAPTIINAGSRTASIEIVNASGSTESVATAAFADPDAGFSVIDTTCTSISVGARCTLNILFAPTGEGALATDLVVAFSSGTEIRSTFSGIGAPEPTLAVIPGVATVGQVVTVQGGGFPAGVTVSLSFGELLDDRDVVVNDTGVFNIPLVVIPNTPAGPMVVSVAGQQDLFGDTETEMLVTRTTRRTNPGVLGSLGARIGS